MGLLNQWQGGGTSAGQGRQSRTSVGKNKDSVDILQGPSKQLSNDVVNTSTHSVETRGRKAWDGWSIVAKPSLLQNYTFKRSG